MKTQQDIKNKWMKLTGLPIVSDDEKFAYISWLETEYLDALNKIPSSQDIMNSNFRCLEFRDKGVRCKERCAHCLHKYG